MGFKMKGPSLYQGKFGTVKINKEGYKNMPDGRSTSSPFQMHTDEHKTGKTKEQLLSEGFTPRDADQMMKDGATTGVVNNKKKKTSKDKTVKDKKSKTKVKSKQGDWQPAFPGADHSAEELKKMTKKQKEDYYN